MNERIKQLLLDAGGQYSSGNQIDWPSWVLGDAGVTKFAELIVRECIGIADEYDGVGSTIVGRIEKHFGVEE